MTSQAGGGLTQLLPIIIIGAAFWLLIFRPQQQRAKQQRQMLSQLEVGDRIVTIGGIYATVVELGEERLLVEVIDGSRLELARRAVASVLPPDTEHDADDADEDEDSAPEMVDETVDGEVPDQGGDDA